MPSKGNDWCLDCICDSWSGFSFAKGGVCVLGFRIRWLFTRSATENMWQNYVLPYMCRSVSTSSQSLKETKYQLDKDAWVVGLSEWHRYLYNKASPILLILKGKLYIMYEGIKYSNQEYTRVWYPILGYFRVQVPEDLWKTSSSSFKLARKFSSKLVT